MAQAALKTNGRRKAMSDTPPVGTKLPDAPKFNGPTDEELIERGVASFVAVSRERDALKAKLNVLELDLQGKEAEIKALRDVMHFSEDQMKLRAAENVNRETSYRNERDLAVGELARSEAQFEDLFKAIVGILQAFRAQGGELVKQATEAE